MQTTNAPAGKKRIAVLISVLLFCLPLIGELIKLLARPSPFGDFIGYWAAGRLFLTHRDPYSVTNLIAVEHAQGWPQAQPLVMLCPPWVLPILGAFGLLPYQLAREVWLAISLLLDVVSALGLWCYFGGRWQSSWIALAVFVTFVPLGTAEYLGQFTPLMLASLTFFLLFLRSQRWTLAGVTMLGLCMKPQLLWLVLLAILLWAVRNRKLRVVGTGVLTVTFFGCLALFINPQISHYFGDAYGPAIDTLCGAGGALRAIFGMEHRWLQFVPSVAGGVWFACYWIRNRESWDWPTHLPLLLIVSVASSPYCWFHDFILALPAFVLLALRGSWRSAPVLAAWLTLQVLIGMPQINKAEAAALSAFWIVFFLLGLLEGNRKHVSAGETQLFPESLAAGL